MLWGAILRGIFGGAARDRIWVLMPNEPRLTPRGMAYYIDPNVRTLDELRNHLLLKTPVHVFDPLAAIGENVIVDGVYAICGPWYPETENRWTAHAVVRNGRIVEVQ